MHAATSWTGVRIRTAATLIASWSPLDLIGLFALAIGFVAWPWLRGELIGQQGVSEYYATVLSFAAQQLRMGELPSWNPYVLSGTPQLADIGNVLFYPLTIPSIMALPLRDAMNVGVVLHLALAGSFMYLYLGTTSVSRSGRFLGAVVYMLSGFAATRIFAGQTQRIVPYAWIPLTLYLVEEIIQGRQRLGATVLGGLVVACQFLGGDPQAFLYAAMTLVAYTVCRLVHVYRRDAGRASYPVAGAASPIRPALLLLTMFFFGGCLTAIQALPALELFLLSVRHGIDPNFALTGSMPPLGLLSLIAPHFFGDAVHGRWGEAELRAPGFYPHSSTFYVGFFTLALVTVALIGSRERWYVRFFGVLGLITLWLALGKFGYLYRAIVYLPILRSFRDIENINMLLPLSAAVLAAFGLERYREPESGAAIWRKVARMLFAALAAAWLLLTGTVLYVWRVHGVILPMYPLIGRLMVQSTIFVLAAAGISAGFLWSRARSASPSRGQVAAVIAFVLVDLLYAGFPLLSAGTDMRAAEEGDAVTRYLGRDRSLYRVVGVSDRAVLFRIQDVEGESGLLPARYSEYTNFLQGYELDTVVRPGGVHGVLITRGLHSPLLGLLNVKYIIFHAGGEREGERDPSTLRGSPGTTEVAPGTFVAANPNFYPRVLDSYGFTVLHDRLAILRELSRAGYNPHRSIVLEESPHLPPDEVPSGEAPGRPADLRVASYSANGVVIHARFTRPGFLLLNDLYYPAWTATVDGRPARVYRANYLFRAVAVPVGDHTVRFIYLDRSLEVGSAVSGLTAIVGLLAWMADRRRRRGKFSFRT